MTERKTPVKCFLVEKICPECAEGTMERADTSVLTSYPPQYRHSCNECGNISNYFESYPYVDYEVDK